MNPSAAERVLKESTFLHFDFDQLLLPNVVDRVGKHLIEDLLDEL